MFVCYKKEKVFPIARAFFKKYRDTEINLGENHDVEVDGVKYTVRMQMQPIYWEDVILAGTLCYFLINKYGTSDYYMSYMEDFGVRKIRTISDNFKWYFVVTEWAKELRN